jgi:hypothetical protein
VWGSAVACKSRWAFRVATSIAFQLHKFRLGGQSISTTSQRGDGSRWARNVCCLSPASSGDGELWAGCPFGKRA